MVDPLLILLEGEKDRWENKLSEHLSKPMVHFHRRWSDMSEFESFFASYAETYMASDVASISEVYEAPFLAVREGHAIHLPDRAAVRDHLAGLMAAYRNAGAARADIAEIDAKSLGRSSAVITVHWNVLDSAGSMVRDLRTTYHVLRTDKGFRILSYTNHD